MSLPPRREPLSADPEALIPPEQVVALEDRRLELLCGFDLSALSRFALGVEIAHQLLGTERKDSAHD